MFATWTSISIGRRVTQDQKIVFRLRGESILIFECLNKILVLVIHDFHFSSAISHWLIHSFFLTSRSINAKVLSATSSVDPVLQSSRALSARPEHKRASCQQRQQVPWTITVVKNVISPPPSSWLSISGHVQHVKNGRSATCQKHPKQQPFQGRCISRMPKTTVRVLFGLFWGIAP